MQGAPVISQTPQLSAVYFDGRSSRAQPVQLQLAGLDLYIKGDGINLVIPVKNVQWPERTRHGIRVAHFNHGASVQCKQTQAWDDWRKQSGYSESWVVSFQQSWRLVLLSVVVLIAFVFALQRWGIPIASRAVVSVIPASVDDFLGKNSLATIDNYLMKPSQLSTSEQASIRAAFERAAQSLPTEKRTKWQLHFRKSKIGPNAFALPGGDMVMTDEMVELVHHDEQIITGVLAHELGHLRERHGLRMLIQVTGLGAIASVLLGDFSTVLAGVPTLLGQASYSREAEKEADAFSVDMLKAAKISPMVMVTLFEKLVQNRANDKQKNSVDQEKSKDKNSDNSWLGIAFSSHPADAERIAFFKHAATNQSMNLPIN
jgi:Zn-dependent protease with chaperone function